MTAIQAFNLQHVRNESHVIKTGLQILQIRGIQIMELRIKEVLHLHERKIQEKSKQYHNLVQNRISLTTKIYLVSFVYGIRIPDLPINYL